jgi:hypothetical protein
VSQAGAVVATVSTLILVLCTLYIGLMVVDSNARSGISTRTLPLQYLSLAFLAVWLFATQIPLSLFVSTRSVQVSAFINGIKISDGFVKTVERALGTKTRYKDYDYCALRLPLPRSLLQP